MAELGFVGSAPESYQVWLGGSPNQTRLAQPYVDKLHHNDIESFLEPIFVYFKNFREYDESFGDFCHRLGFAALREFADTYKPEATSSSKSRHRVSIRDEVYTKLKAAANSQDRPMTELVNEALEAYFESLV
jgi:sulfite reductase (ferredoxin)